MEGVFRRRNLPHWDVGGKPVFITACLAGSLSSVGLSKIRRFRVELTGLPSPKGVNEKEWARNKRKRVFRLVDELLDQQSRVKHLTDPRLATIVQDALLHFAGERYDLLSFVVMPSHHHWLFLPRPNWEQRWAHKNQHRSRPKSPREIISHSIQSYTGTMCNRKLGVSGKFWQDETFDHFARTEAETLRIIHYIENNPVKAGLAARPEDWQFSSAQLRKSTGSQQGEPIVVQASGM